jgi:hypothetical protein
MTKEDNISTDRSDTDNISDVLLNNLKWLVLMGMNDNASVRIVGEKMIKVIESKFKPY